MNREIFLKYLKTNRLGRNAIFLDETGSTNSYAIELREKVSIEGGTVIFADRQTAGRGRFDRKWHSDGGLAMTVVIKPESPVPQPATITLMAGAAVAKALSSITGIDIKVKYPNDILLKGKKCGGILTEMKGGEDGFIFIGIGINVEQEIFPPDIERTATSLKLAGTSVSREETAAAILNGMEPMLSLFFRDGFQAIRGVYMEVDATTGKNIRISRLGGDIHGKAAGIGIDGSLLVETGSGLIPVSSGEIFLKG